jgi:hypothetical protein
MQFETITHLRHFCEVFGQTVTAGQRCRLPKASSTPKKLCQNDVLNVVCGGHDVEEPFNPRLLKMVLILNLMAIVNFSSLFGTSAMPTIPTILKRVICCCFHPFVAAIPIR